MTGGTSWGPAIGIVTAAFRRRFLKNGLRGSAAP